LTLFSPEKYKRNLAVDRSFCFCIRVPTYHRALPRKNGESAPHPPQKILVTPKL